MIVNLQSTGTEFGMSKDLVAIACERRAWLDHQYEKTLPTDAIPYLAEEKLDKRSKTPKALPVASLAGTGVHALADLWYKGEQFRIEDVRFQWYGKDIEATHPATCAEARRLFQAYALKYDPKGMGNIVGVEVQLKAPLSLFGCHKTGAADIVIELATEEQVRQFEHKRQVTLPGPGYYIVDIKTDDRDEGPKTDLEYQLRPQFPLYMMLYEEQFKSHPLRGTIVDLIFKSAEVKLRTLFIPTPDSDQREMVRNAVAIARVGRESKDPPPARITSCLTWGNACHHYVAGRCKRY